jgi:hypothetical protein
MAAMRGHRPVEKMRLWWRVRFSKKRQVRLLTAVLDSMERDGRVVSAECPYCHQVFYADKGRDPLHHHDEYCDEWPEE